MRGAFLVHPFSAAGYEQLGYRNRITWTAALSSMP
jgi:hypothetical protein